MKTALTTFLGSLLCCLMLLCDAAILSSRPATGGTNSPSELAERSPTGFLHSTVDTQQLSLFVNGYFPALHGYFFIDDSAKLHVYRALREVWSPQSSRFTLQPEDDDLKSRWKGEPYYHEVYTLREGEWVPKVWDASSPMERRGFSQAPTRYLKFDSCDKQDRLDLHRDDLKKPLWHDIRIKDVIELGNFSAVVFSADPAKFAGVPVAHEPNEHSIGLALLTARPSPWELSGDIRAVSKANYCGSRILSAMRGSRRCTILLLFFNEGEYSYAYSYVVD